MSTLKSTESLRAALKTRTLVADGAMGTMIQSANPSLDDFQGHEGCNEILNITRPDLIAEIHRKYLDAGVDCIETNTFGANLGNLGEYGIPERTYELAKAGAEIAAKVVGEYSPRRWVLGSMGPGTKLPTLLHVTYSQLEESYFQAASGLIEGGADGLLIETTQDLLQTKAAVNGARRGISKSGKDIVLIAQVTIETNGTMLLGSEIGAALNSLAALDIDLIGLNCATGPTEMSEHLRYLSKHSKIPISCMPNAGLPVLEDGGARYPLNPKDFSEALVGFVRNYGVQLVGGCCGTTPEHLSELVSSLRNNSNIARLIEKDVTPDHGASSLYQFVSFNQDQTYLSIGERANANGSKAFREALLEENWDKCIEIAKEQIRDGAHLLDLSVDYVGRDGVRDMKEIASRLATASTLPIVLDSTEPETLRAGLEVLGGRCVINSVNYEDGDGADSRFARIMPIVKEHGAAVIALTIDEKGQARTKEWKVAVARRLISDLTENWNIEHSDIIVDCLTFPIATGQEETRGDARETIEAIAQLKSEYPQVNTTLGVSNVSFGLKPAARVILNSVFLAEAVNAGLDSAIIHPSKIVPLNKIPKEQLEVALDLVYDRRRFQGDECIYDPLTRFLEIFEDVATQNSRKSRAEELAELPLAERLQRRIIDGEKSGIEKDLDEALKGGRSPISIINDDLLAGMKVVGDLFGSGQMQLPFVLQSAEVMKIAVAYLEEFMEKSDVQERGSILLATVKGDVHDIGKNLVDIILTNNGYRTVNIGIKQTINQIVEAAEVNQVDVIGMSGLLVKSTVIMKENLEELTARGLAKRWPVLLGGAALTRTFVEDDLASSFPGTVRYAKDAFEGLTLMDKLMAIKSGDSEVELPALKKRVTKRMDDNEGLVDTRRSEVSSNNPIPKAPFWGTKVVKGIPLQDFAKMIDERALFVGQWGLRGGKDNFSAVLDEARPRLRDLLAEAQINSWFTPAVVYGYFPCYSEGNDLVLVDLEGKNEVTRFTFPRQRRDRRLCIADFFRAKSQNELDVISLQVVTMGSRISEITNQLFLANDYRRYLELHGLSVQLTEALAEYWHARVRSELQIDSPADSDLMAVLDQGYQGSRYSFGYPACPDLSQQIQLCALLDTSRIEVSLSEEHQLHPEQSTSAIVVHHPEAKYFNAN
jgi:5-methyltetrahydrofolate--homocysteine methyltransferase